MDDIVPAIFVIVLFIGLPWLILHYITRWKTNGTMTVQDENLLDELHDIARRLDDRVTSIERIIAADRDQPARITELRPDLRITEARSQPLRKEY